MLVTGGGGGLGRCIAETYGRGGGSVVVFDVKNEKGGEEEGDEEDGVRYFECDIGNPKMVEEVWGRVCKEVGVPTIVINCAGIVHGKGGLQLTSDEVARYVCFLIRWPEDKLMNITGASR